MDILKNRNFLLLFLGRIFTNIGDSLYYVAAMWLVYKLSGNPFYSGLAGFLTLLPSALQFLTGPFVDRWQIKNTLVITQVLQCILILIIPITHYFDLLTVQLLLIIMPIVAFIEQFAYPAQSKALPLLLHKTQLLKGNSLFSFAYQGIDLICTTLSGILVALFGAITLYVIDSFTFAITALLFFSLKMPQQTETGTSLSTKQYFSDLKEGFSIVFRSLMSVFLIGSVVANFSIGMTMAILPSFADSLGGVKSYGFFLAAISAGSLIGALFSSWVGKRNVGRASIISFATGAIFWFLSTVVPFQWLSIFLFGLAWVPIGATNILFATISQILIPNRYIGRINSVMRSMGTIAMPFGSLIAMPFGSLIGGYAANIFSSQLIFALASIGILFISLVWLLHPKLRALPKADEITADTFGVQFKEERGKGAAL